MTPERRTHKSLLRTSTFEAPYELVKTMRASSARAGAAARAFGKQSLIAGRLRPRHYPIALHLGAFNTGAQPSGWKRATCVALPARGRCAWPMSFVKCRHGTENMMMATWRAHTTIPPPLRPEIAIWPTP